MTTTQQQDTLEILKSALAECHPERLLTILKQAPPHELSYVLDELSIAEQAAVMRLLGDEHLSSLLATGKLDDAVEATASSLERQRNPLRRFLRMLEPGRSDRRALQADQSHAQVAHTRSGCLRRVGILRTPRLG